MRELVFTQDQNGYKYGTFSLLLFDFIQKQRLKGSVLEVGAGCGIIGLLLKYFSPYLCVSLLDILEKNVKLCEKNAEENELEVEILHCDFLTFSSSKKFDTIISNPPFYRAGAIKSKNSHKNTSKSSEALPLKEFIAQASANLKPQGRLIFCYEIDALSELCANLLIFKFTLLKLCFVHKNATSKAKLVLILAQKGVKSQCVVQEPLFLYENDKESAYLQALHANLNLKSKAL